LILQKGFVSLRSSCYDQDLKQQQSTTRFVSNWIDSLNLNRRNIHSSSLKFQQQNPSDGKEIKQLSDLMSNEEFYPNPNDDDKGIPEEKFAKILKELRFIFLF
jgi:hypothetical protein